MNTKFIDKYDEITLEHYSKISVFKWFDGNFVCLRCSNRNFYEGARPYSQKCSKCKYDESVTTGTVFEHLRMPLGKALDILFGIMNSTKIAVNKSIALDKNGKYDDGLLARYVLIFRKSAEILGKDNRVSRKSVWYLLKRIMDAVGVDDYRPERNTRNQQNLPFFESIFGKIEETVDDEMDKLAVEELHYIEDVVEDGSNNETSGKQETIDVITSNLDYINFPSWYRGVHPRNRERYYILFLLFQPLEYTNELTISEEDLLLHRLINLTHPNPDWEGIDEVSMFISSIRAEKEEKQKR